jgi:uncharacterized protein YbaR (Trm112 family)
MSVPVELLACPACGAGLRLLGACLCCQGCAQQYAVLDGIPLLMTPGDRRRFGGTLAERAGAAMRGRYAERASRRLAARLKRALRPPLPLVHNPAEPSLPCPPGSHNLWIGGGGRLTAGFFNLDVDAFPGVDLVANAERLPFQAGSLDAVECDAVLEHVEQPLAVGREIFRVLKPGGWLHAVVPFCHPYHAYPADFRRWTLPGFRDWVAGLGFEVVTAGVRTGPTATLLAFLLEYCKVVLGEGLWGKAACAAAGWVLFPLRYLDCWLNRGPRSHALANHVFVLARKP